MIGNWLRRYPLFGYFVLAFAVSWGGILLILAATGFDLSAMQSAEAGLVFVVMLLGPSVSGLILTALVDDRLGMGQLCASLLRWQAGVRRRRLWDNLRRERMEDLARLV